MKKKSGLAKGRYTGCMSDDEARQPPHDEQQLRAALERIRDMAQTILAETSVLLSAGDKPSSFAKSSPDLARAKEELKTFRKDLREHRKASCIGFYDMEYLVREAHLVLQRAKDLGAEWPQALKETLAEQLGAAETEAEELAVQLMQRGLDDFLKHTKDRVAYLKRHPEHMSPSDARAIRDESETLDKDWDEEIKAKCADRLGAVRREALEIADELETAAHLNNIKAALHRRISNVLSIQRIREEMMEATAFLQQKGNLTPELQQRIRQGQERAARFRADKKLADARVAEAAGRSQTNERLRKEAAAVLAQDWEAFFPNETPPQIS
jgi:hypothetical protein